MHPKYLIYLGVLILLIGGLWYIFPNMWKWFGNLPGDIRIERENSRFYFPIATMVILSIIINLLMRFLK